MAKLIILNRESKGLEFILSNDTISLGRDDFNAITFSDSQISRFHARIYPAGDSYIIEDTGSSNGTFVNKFPITKHLLEEGDEIQLGRTLISFISLSDNANPELEDYVSQRELDIDTQTLHNITDSFSLPPDDVDPLLAKVKDNDAKEIQNAYIRLKTLYRISNEIGKIDHLPSLLIKILEVVLRITKADRGCIMLLNKNMGEAGQFRVAKSKDDNDPAEITISASIINEVLSSCKGLLTVDAMHDERLMHSKSIIADEIRAAMCVPLMTKETVLGVMHVDTKGNIHAFNKDDLDMLTIIANSVALVIDNARLFGDLKRAYHELKERQAQLIESEKISALGHLASGIAHEINHPLTSIIGYASLINKGLTKGKTDEKSYKKYAMFSDILKKEGIRCKNIAQDLLNLARKKKTNMTDTNINDVIDAALGIGSYHLKKTNIKIEKNYSSDIPQITADPNQLQQVFLNLIINAKDAIAAVGKEGKLTITTRTTEDSTAVEALFQDTGTGISKEVIDEMFKPLFTTKSEGEGTGLGLFVSGEIIENHNGSINVRSEVGKGTTFTVTLPLAQAI